MLCAHGTPADCSHVAIWMLLWFVRGVAAALLYLTYLFPLLLMMMAGLQGPNG
jgi:hypothetical protein